jgi:hypothetical protein
MRDPGAPVPRQVVRKHQRLNGRAKDDDRKARQRFIEKNLSLVDFVVKYDPDRG